MNFAAPVNFPKKFIYRGCTRTVGNGLMCARTVEGPFHCQHNSISLDSWEQMYRFDVFVVDGSFGSDCPPLRATIFDAASTLLEISPTDFCSRTENDQVSIVHSVTYRMNLVEVFIRTKERQAIVQALSILPNQISEPVHTHRSNSGTPAQRSKFPSHSMPSIVNAPQGAGDSWASFSSAQNTSAAQVTSVKGKLKDLDSSTSSSSAQNPSAEQLTSVKGKLKDLDSSASSSSAQNPSAEQLTSVKGKLKDLDSSASSSSAQNPSAEQLTTVKKATLEGLIEMIDLSHL